MRQAGPETSWLALTRGDYSKCSSQTRGPACWHQALQTSVGSRGRKSLGLVSVPAVFQSTQATERGERVPGYTAVNGDRPLGGPAKAEGLTIVPECLCTDSPKRPILLHETSGG